MSNKRQKIADTECSALVREALEEYLISDLAAIVLDEYQSHSHSIKEDRESGEWIEVTFPCSLDCRAHEKMSVRYTRPCSPIIHGPFSLQRISRSLDLSGDGPLSSHDLWFVSRSGERVVSIRQSAWGSVIDLHRHHLVLAAYLEDFVDQVLRHAIDFALRCKLVLLHDREILG
jgi:hypothetical protein